MTSVARERDVSSNAVEWKEETLEGKGKTCGMVYGILEEAKMSQMVGRAARDVKKCRRHDFLREPRDQESNLPPFQTDPIPD